MAGRGRGRARGQPLQTPGPQAAAQQAQGGAQAVAQGMGAMSLNGRKQGKFDFEDLIEAGFIVLFFVPRIQ